MPASSMPSATGIRSARKRFTGAMPLFSRKLDEQLWQILTPWAAQVSMSFAVSQTPWPMVSLSDSRPKRAR